MSNEHLPYTELYRIMTTANTQFTCKWWVEGTSWRAPTSETSKSISFHGIWSSEAHYSSTTRAFAESGSLSMAFAFDAGKPKNAIEMRKLHPSARQNVDAEYKRLISIPKRYTHSHIHTDRHRQSIIRFDCRASRLLCTHVALEPTISTTALRTYLIWFFQRDLINREIDSFETLHRSRSLNANGGNGGGAWWYKQPAVFGIPN